MSEIKSLTKKINEFIKRRKPERFQKPKNLAISLLLEAAEVLEHFQWKSDSETKIYAGKNKAELSDELADVAIYLFKLADKIKVDLPSAIVKKLGKAAIKYPINKVKGDLRLKNYLTIKRKYRQGKRKVK